MKKLKLYMIYMSLILLLTPITVVAAPTDSSNVLSTEEELQTNINIVWTCIAAFLAFFMQEGFAIVESSLTRVKTQLTF